jgi:hypothetical protein
MVHLISDLRRLRPNAYRETTMVATLEKHTPFCCHDALTGRLSAPARASGS